MSSSAVEVAALEWWTMKRPAAWSEQQHLANPVVNAVGEAEKHLCHAVAALVRALQRQRQPHGTVTYEVTTPESRAKGEAVARGYHLPGGWEHEIEDDLGRYEDVIAEARAGGFDLRIGVALREAFKLGITHGVTLFSGGLRAVTGSPPPDHFQPSEADDPWDYVEDGEERSYVLTIEGVSDGTRARIARLLERA